MTRAFGSIAVAAVVLALAPCAQAQTADELVEKHLAAVGGRAALAKLTSQKRPEPSRSAQGADIGTSIDISRRRRTSRAR